MNTVRENARRAAGWLDDKLVPLLGPATITPREGVARDATRDDPHPGVAENLCPMCHHGMDHHIVDRDPRTGHTYLTCPDSGTVIGTERHSEEPGTQTRPVLS